MDDPNTVYPAMTCEDIQYAIGHAHFDSYANAIKDGQNPAKAIQIADLAAAAKRQTLLNIQRQEQTKL